MPEIAAEIPRDVLSDICGFCGIAIYQQEIAAQFNGTIIDYVHKVPPLSGSFVLCGECWMRVREALMADMEMAVNKRRRTFEGDQ